MSNQFNWWLQCTQCGFGEWLSSTDDRCDGSACEFCGIGPVKISWESNPSKRTSDSLDERQILKDRIKSLENIINEVILSDPDDAWYVAKQMWKEINK